MKVGLVERYRYAKNVSRREFTPRLFAHAPHHVTRPQLGHAVGEAAGSVRCKSADANDDAVELYSLDECGFAPPCRAPTPGPGRECDREWPMKCRKGGGSM